MIAAKKLTISLLGLILIGILFSYRLLDVPLGLTVDEGAFGYNGVLLAETLHDQNGKLLPIFVLSNEGKDWRQPITQYYQAAFFKIFGPSVFNLRFSSVVITLISAVLIFHLSKLLLGVMGGIWAVILYLTTPLVMIQSHLGLDNIMPIPFASAWLLSLLLFQKTNQKKYLVFSALALGFAFYTYKGMRAVVPVWIILTLAFLYFSKIKFYLKRATLFLAVLSPFFLIIPYLQNEYPGAILGGTKLSFDSVYSFLYPYLSSFDPSFLFISGDSTIYHSTSHHGMFLLATLPLFIIGVYQVIRKENFWLFLLASFFLTPLFYGLVDSVHRASRLMAFIPMYVLIAALGVVSIRNKLLLVAILALMFINYFDFVKYYWFTYPKFSENSFGKLAVHQSYKTLAAEASKRNLTPYISQDLTVSEGEAGRFYEVIYFNRIVNRWSNNDINPPKGSILLTNRDEIPGMNKLQTDLKYYKLQINE